jgi:hypothetical protein
MRGALLVVVTDEEITTTIKRKYNCSSMGNGNWLVRVPIRFEDPIKSLAKLGVGTIGGVPVQRIVTQRVTPEERRAIERAVNREDVLKSTQTGLIYDLEFYTYDTLGNIGRRSKR